MFLGLKLKGIRELKGDPGARAPEGFEGAPGGSIGPGDVLGLGVIFI